MERTPLTPENRWQVVATSAAESGSRTVFRPFDHYREFHPVFALEAQEGRLFAPLAIPRPMQWQQPLGSLLRSRRF